MDSFVIVSDDESNSITTAENLSESVIIDDSMTESLTASPPTTSLVPVAVNKRLVTLEAYKKQEENVNLLENKLTQTHNAIKSVDLQSLHDKGAQLYGTKRNLVSLLNTAKQVLSTMQVDTQKQGNMKPVLQSWNDLQNGLATVLPKTFGQQAMKTYNTQMTSTVQGLEQMHKALANRPTEDNSVPTPKQLRVELMQHQKVALKWLLWRERQTPRGGILADDMGLGKTLTIISLILKSNDLKNEDNDENDTSSRKSKNKGGTLVVCPPSVLHQWRTEIETKCQRNTLTVNLYHGSNRESSARRLATYDVVITTYAICTSERATGPLFRIDFERIVLDEAHIIRNFKTKTAQAVCELSAERHWCLSGTPVHNKELDMYSLMKFLKCTPFDDLAVWKRWIGDKSTSGQERLNTIVSSVLLRRTKQELMVVGQLQQLPPRKVHTIEITMPVEEMQVYQKLLIFSRTLFSQFLHQKADKNHDLLLMTKSTDNSGDVNVDAAISAEYEVARKRLFGLGKFNDIQQFHILVLLVRLRQICCHPCLIKKILNDDDIEEAQPGASATDNLINQLSQLNIDEKDLEDDTSTNTSNQLHLNAISKNYLSPTNYIFNEDYKSSKILKLLHLLENDIPKNEKTIIVSQWSSYLTLICQHLRANKIECDTLDGSIVVHKRGPIIDRFNDPKSGVQVLLLSLTAGGVGLNLTGANNLVIVDLHWNPQLERQAQDRIYRVGQKKTVNIYKFITKDTIEQRIQSLQSIKLEIADDLLTGSKRASNSKLTLQDLKMLFQ